MATDGFLAEYTPLEAEREDLPTRVPFEGWTDSSDSEDTDPTRCISEMERKKFNEALGSYDLKMERWDVPKACPYCTDKLPWKNLEALFSHAHGVSQPGTKCTARSKAQHRGLAEYIALDVVKQMNYDPNTCKSAIVSTMMGRKRNDEEEEGSAVKKEDKLIVWPPRVLIAGLELVHDPERSIHLSIMGNPDLEADIKKLVGSTTNLKKTPKVLFGPSGSCTGFAIVTFEDSVAGEMSSRGLADKLQKLLRGKEHYFRGKGKERWYGWIPTPAEMKRHAPRETFETISYSQLINQHKNLEKVAKEEQQRVKRLKLEETKAKKEIDDLKRRQEFIQEEMLQMQELHKRQMENLRMELEEDRKQSMLRLGQHCEEYERNECQRAQLRLQEAVLQRENELRQRHQRELSEIWQQAAAEQKELVERVIKIAENPEEGDRVIDVGLQQWEEGWQLRRERQKNADDLVHLVRTVVREGQSGAIEAKDKDEMMRHLTNYLDFSVKPLLRDVQKVGREIVKEDSTLIPCKIVCDTHPLMMKLRSRIKSKGWLPGADEAALLAAADGLARSLIGLKDDQTEEDKDGHGGVDKNSTGEGGTAEKGQKHDPIARVKARVKCPPGWDPATKHVEVKDANGVQFPMFAVKENDAYYQQIVEHYGKDVAKVAGEIMLEKALYNASAEYPMLIPYDPNNLYREIYYEMAPAKVMRILYDKYKQVLIDKKDLEATVKQLLSPERTLRSRKK